MRKNKLYAVAMFGWWALVFGGLVVVLTGTAEPYVSVSTFPSGIAGVFGAVLAALLVPTAFLGVLTQRAWKKAGKRAGLTPEGGGVPIVGDKCDFRGTVRGRPVEISTFSHTIGSGENRKKHTYTVVEAELTRPLEDGFLVSVDAQRGDSIAVNFMPSSETAVTADTDFEVVGDRSGAYASEFFAGRTGEALDALSYLGTLRVGDASAATTSLIPDGLDGLLGGIDEDLEGELGAASGGDASTVTHTTEGTVLDGAELERQVDVVVAVADAAETVDAEPRPA